MNAGAQASHGAALLFCHADTQLPSGWREALCAALAQSNVCGGSFQVTLLPASGLLRAFNQFRTPANWRFMYGDQAQFMTRVAYERTGGFRELPLMEDLEMSRALHRLGRLVRLPLRVTSSSRRFLEKGPLRQLLLDSALVIGYLYLGLSAEAAARLYRSSRER